MVSVLGSEQSVGDGRSRDLEYIGGSIAPVGVLSRTDGTHMMSTSTASTHTLFTPTYTRTRPQVTLARDDERIAEEEERENVRTCTHVYC